MLEALRKNVTGILAKILIGLLIVSFAVWGIGDMVRGYGRDVVASVGGTPIKATEFRNAYQGQINNLSRQFGRRLTPQEAKVFGVERQVLDRLTGAAAVDNQTQSLKLDLSDKTIEKGVYADPMFKDASGSFSADRMRDILRQGGYSEQQFFEARKRDTIRNQITSSILSNVAAPKVLTDMLQTYRDEKRVVQYIEVVPGKAVQLGKPTDKDLKQTYESNKRRFVTPEYRKFQALLLTAKAAKENLNISDAELKTSYETDKASFTIPEQRRIQQISFKDEAAAIAAKAELAAGKKFIDIAKAAGAKENDIDLGMLTKTALIDPKIAEVAFKLKKDEISDAVKGRFKTVLLRATEIKAGEQRTFEAVKADIRKQIENERVADKIQEIQNNVDDNRLAGKSLKEISKLLDLPFLDIASIDRQGNKPDGKPAITTLDKVTLISKAFAAEVGVENEVLQLANDGLAWLNLIAVTPEKQKPFKDVTAGVTKTWTELETRKKLQALASSLAKRVKDGAALADVAKEIGANVKTTPAFKRGDSVPNLPPPAISRAFALKLNATATAGGSNADIKLVVRLTKIEQPKKATDANAKALREQTEQQLQTDIFGAYIAELKKRQEVTINQAVVDQTTGASVDTAYQN
jgi:peptidyl-prolyl cis-trans isomerase D